MMDSMSDDTMSSKSDGNNKLKLVCSYGGKILPRPGDGHLRYSGGETRVVALNRNVTYEEMMNKLEDLCGGSVILKYQLPTEDLDALVSITCEEDLQNMKEEYDRFESCCFPRLRAFCFPLKQHPSTDNPTLEQRYIDAINGISPHPKSEPNCSTSSSASSSDTMHFRNYCQRPPPVLSEVDMNKRDSGFQAKPMTQRRRGETDSRLRRREGIESRLRKVRSEGMMVTNISSPPPSPPPPPVIVDVVSPSHVELLQRTRSSPNLEQYPCINYSQAHASNRTFVTAQCHAQPVIVRRTRETGGELLRGSRLGYCKSDIHVNRRPPQQILLIRGSDKHCG